MGPYKLEFMLQGFRTSVQTGIVLQVGASPTINARSRARQRRGIGHGRRESRR